MLLDKLIQIANEADSVGDLRRDIKHAVIEEMRCDKCKHWGSYSNTDKGTCETVPSEDYIWTAPDFFCAYWENK